MKNAWLVGLLAGLVLLIGLGVGYWQWQANQQSKQQLSRVTIRAARNYWPGQFWKEIADKKGWFEEAGLKVELIDTNPDYVGSLQNLVDRKMDENAFTPYDFVLQNTKGANLVAVIEPDISYGIDQLIALPAITSVGDLKGKRVGVGRGTYTEFLLSVALEREGMQLSDVQVVEVAIEDAASALQSGRAVAVFTYDPYSSEAIEQLKAHKIFDTSEVPGLVPSLDVFPKEFVEQYPDVVQAYVKVWHKTTQYILENKSEAVAIISEIYEVEPSEVEAYMQGDKILTLNDNLSGFAYTAGYESLHGNFRRVNQFLIDNGHTDQKLESVEFIDNTFIQALK
jgi:NitT/TauT family transport system substrate-binding protein